MCHRKRTKNTTAYIFRSGYFNDIRYSVFIKNKNRIIKDPGGKISIAVNNFNDNSADSTLGNLKIAIPDILRNDLANSGELKVQNSQTMFELYQSMGQNQQAAILPSVSRDAAVKLRTGTFVTGSFQRIGDTILILAELTDTKSGEVLWSGNVKGIKEQYPYLTLSLSGKLKNFLEIKALRQQVNPEFSDAFTTSPEAYRKYIDGMQLMIKMNWPAAIKSFEDAYNTDTTFSLAAFYAAYLVCYTQNSLLAAEWTQKAYNTREKLPYDYKSWVEMWQVFYNVRDYDLGLKYCDQLMLSDIRSRYFWWDLGVSYEDCEVFDKAVKAFAKVEEITRDWDEEWDYPEYYWRYGYALHRTGSHEKEAELYEEGSTRYPDRIEFPYYQAICAVSHGDTAQEKLLLDKFLKIARDIHKASEVNIEINLSTIYENENMLDEAEKHCRNALKADPEGIGSRNVLSLFLARHNRKISEADSLSMVVLKIRPESPTALWAQGMVCFNLGNYEKALELLQHSKELGKILWNTSLEKDLKKVKEAIARQK